MVLPANQHIKSVIKRDPENAYCSVEKLQTGHFFEFQKKMTELEFKLSVSWNVSKKLFSLALCEKTFLLQKGEIFSLYCDTFKISAIYGA